VKVSFYRFDKNLSLGAKVFKLGKLQSTVAILQSHSAIALETFKENP